MRSLWHFFVHLRWHYQVFVLSGGYLVGGLFQPLQTPREFILQFLSVHLLLNGGITAFNSYFDEDEGPIGGIENPPPLDGWMLPASIIVQLAGLVLAWREGAVFVGLYVLTMVLSVLYSAPPFRWKSSPVLSLVAVGVGTGTNTFLMGYLAAGDFGIDGRTVVGGLGTATLLLSMYPVSQVFQIEEDRERGDLSFAVHFGLEGVKRFFAASYPVGLLLTSAALASRRADLGLGFLIAGTAGGLITARTLSRLQGSSEEYRVVMRLKYSASLAFVGFLTAALIYARISGTP